MTSSAIKEKLLAQFDQLPHDLQLRLLDFAKALSPKGVDGRSLLRFEGFIPPDEIGLISEAIGEECEKVDTREW